MFIWPVGWMAGLLVQPARSSRTDVQPTKPAAPQAACVLEKPRDQMLLPGFLSAVPGTLRRPSHDLKLRFGDCGPSIIMMEEGGALAGSTRAGKF